MRKELGMWSVQGRFITGHIVGGGTPFIPMKTARLPGNVTMYSVTFQIKIKDGCPASGRKERVRYAIFSECAHI